MHAVLAEMLQLWPNDTAIQNDEAYTRLLLIPGDAAGNEDLINIEHLAERLVQLEPASLPHRTLLALARLRQGRGIAALQAYDNIDVSPAALSPSALAVHAAVLSANGHPDDARLEIKQAPLEKLLPEEQAGTANLRE
jgi:sirohydrochlorin ferrochelatase